MCRCLRLSLLQTSRMFLWKVEATVPWMRDSLIWQRNGDKWNTHTEKKHQATENRIKITVFTTIKMNVDCAMDGGFCTKPLCWKVFVAKVSNNFLIFFSLCCSHSECISSVVYSHNLVLIPLPVVVVESHEMKKIQKKITCLRNTNETFLCQNAAGDTNITYSSVDF